MQITWDPLSAFMGSSNSSFPLLAAGGKGIADVVQTGADVGFTLKMIPLQVHWHVTAEHMRDGKLVRLIKHPYNKLLMK
jgi:hypothetical protein